MIDFECTNPASIVITDGPDVLSCSETIHILSRHAPSSPQTMLPYPSFLLFRLSLFFRVGVTSSDEDGFWNVFDGCNETQILKPAQFPNATLHYALPVHPQSFILLFSSNAQTIIAFYRYSLLSILCTQKESIRRVKEVHYFGHSSFLIQFASEWLFLKDSSLTHIPTTDLLFCDDFTNSGVHQFLLISPSSPHPYSLLSHTLCPLLQDALHAHQHKRPAPSGGGCELVFQRGLGRKQRELETQIATMREEVAVMKELSEGHVSRRVFFVPWIGDCDVEGSVCGEDVEGHLMNNSTEEHGKQSNTEGHQRSIKQGRRYTTDRFNNHEIVKEEGGHLWVEGYTTDTVLGVVEWSNGVVTCLQEPHCIIIEECENCYPLSVLLFAWNGENLRFVGRHVMEGKNDMEMTRLLVNVTKEPLESLQRLNHMHAEWIPITPSIQALSLPMSMTHAFQLEETLRHMNSRTTVRLDVITTPLMEHLLRTLRDALTKEIMYYKDNGRDLTRVKKEGLFLRLKSEALCMKLLYLVGGEDAITKWKEFMESSLCSNKQSIVHMFTHSTLQLRANSPPPQGERTWDPSYQREDHQPALHHRACPK